MSFIKMTLKGYTCMYTCIYIYIYLYIIYVYNTLINNAKGGNHKNNISLYYNTGI